jgi:transposase-like protein
MEPNGTRAKARRSSVERRRLVEAYRKSGVSVEAFAIREGVAVSTLYQWLRTPRLSARSTPRLARVVVTPTKAAATPRDEAPVLLEYVGVRMSVRRGFDKCVLADVLSVLGQRV